MERSSKGRLPELVKRSEHSCRHEWDTITLDHLMGEGDWVAASEQAAGIPKPVLEFVTSQVEKAFLEMRPSGLLPYYLEIFHGPTEPYLHFIERMTAAMEQQVPKPHDREEGLEQVAFTHANEQCKAAILTLPKKPNANPTLQEMLQVVGSRVPLMAQGPPQRGRKQDHRTAAAAEAPNSTNVSALHMPGQMRRSFWGPSNRPCLLCGRKGHWCQQCPLKEEFNKFKSGKGGGGKGDGGGRPHKGSQQNN